MDLVLRATERVTVSETTQERIERIKAWTRFAEKKLWDEQRSTRTANNEVLLKGKIAHNEK